MVLVLLVTQLLTGSDVNLKEDFYEDGCMSWCFWSVWLFEIGSRLFAYSFKNDDVFV